MKWVICGAMTLLVGACVMVAAIASTPKAPVEDVMYDFNLVEGTPNVITNDPSPISFELVAVTEPTPDTDIKEPNIAPLPESEFKLVPQKSPWEIAEKAERPRRVLFFTRDSCVYCQAFIRGNLPAMIDSGWIVGRSPFAHIQVIDVDVPEEKKIAKSHNIVEVPAFVRLVNGKAEDTHQGTLTFGELAEFYKPSSKTKADPKTEAPQDH